MRKLATIRKIDRLREIPGADFIEVADVDGWELVVKKDEFKKGDLGVYFEIDSVLPDHKRYEFLKKMTNTAGGQGYRIKTIKLRKQISQGIMLPLHMFDEFSQLIRVGEDVTEALDVWLYEPVHQGGPMSNAECRSVGKKVFPDFLRKTDQERIQNKMHYFDTYKDMTWEATKKLDGSSMTIWNYDKAYHMPAGVMNKKWKNKLLRLWERFTFLFKKPDTFGVCSRNVNLREKEGNAFWGITNQMGLRDTLKGKNVALQGELVGPSIQKNHEKMDKNEFYLFDIFDIDKQEYLLPEEREEWLHHNDPTNRIKTVPFHNYVNIFNACSDVPKMQTYVEGPSMNEGTISEGMVFKSMTDRGMSFKCISNKYLLKCED